MLDTWTGRIEQRRAQGHVRACHGDLHLGNIALVEGRPRIFDCIEFNDELRLIDTMNDVAFLVMDCDARGHAELGLHLLSRYLEHSGDYEGLALLRPYQFYRAGVRGKVALLLSEDTGLSADAAAAKRREADAYFRLAAAYAQAPKAPRLFAVGGLSGSGKSRLALLGSGAEGALVIRSDATRKRLGTGVASLYTPMMTEATYAAMLAGADAALGAGFSVILDATFLDASHRHRARDLGARRGLPFTQYWLDVPVPELRRRVRARVAAGRDVSDADLAVLEAQLAGYRRPDEADIRVLEAADAWPGSAAT
jgi:predicted kinase